MCRPHVVLLGLETRVEVLRGSLSVLDNWLDGNAGVVMDEVRVRRVKHWRGEVLEQIDFTGAKLEAVHEELVRDGPG